MQRAEGQHACVLLYDLFLKALRSSESCQDGALPRRYNIMQPCRCPRKRYASVIQLNIIPVATVSVSNKLVQDVDK